MISDAEYSAHKYKSFTELELKNVNLSKSLFNQANNNVSNLFISSVSTETDFLDNCKEQMLKYKIQEEKKDQTALALP